MNATEFDLITVTPKSDSYVMDFITDSGSVSLQVSRDALFNHVEDKNMAVIEVYSHQDVEQYQLDLPTYVRENLTEVSQSYLESL